MNPAAPSPDDADRAARPDAADQPGDATATRGPGGGRHERGAGSSGDGTGPGGSAPVERSVIALRPLASPLPLGLFAFGVGNVLLAVGQLGGFSRSDLRVSMVVLATFVAVPQAAAAVIAFLTREPVVATLLGLLSVTWATDLVVQQYTGAATSGPRGVLFLALGGVLVLLSLPGLTAKPVLSVLLIAAAGRFVAGGLYDLTAATGWERVSGGVAVAVAALALYLGTALVYEDVRHRTVLPVGRRGESRSAMKEGLAAQEQSLPQEAGVRAQL